jgi:Ca-activated chloride channel family protein
MITIIAVLVGGVAAVGEYLHARRIRRITKLAFGPEGKPAVWAAAAPVMRCVGIAAATWGALVLAGLDPVEVETVPSPRASRQLLICLDVSPSMQIKDAGPDAEKVSRAIWAGKLTQAILDRLDMKDTRITLVGFYSKALPILQDTTDKHVVANILDGLPMSIAFEPGSTDLMAGIELSLKIARPWARKSATLVVISDGDASGPPTPIAVPASIANTIVIGVGDPNKASLISGHSSRQDTWSLKQVAARLGGLYHEGNRLHLPTSVLDSLAMVTPRVSDVIGLRDAGLIAIGVGGGLTGLIGPALMFAGLRRTQRRLLRPARSRASALPTEAAA